MMCSLQNQPQANNEFYIPMSKVKEMLDYLEERDKKLFLPGKQLSSDESLIRALCRIKFKMRIISKPARY
jgi:Transposase IS4